ncbi:MAG: helix-turn-helix transcriptional regulator [Gammaproteobacteria bacterium]
MTTTNTLPDLNPLIRRPAVEQSTGLTRSTIYRRIKSGLFVKPVSIGGDRVAWNAHEVAAINAARIAGKSDDEIRHLVAELEATRTAQGEEA